MTRADGVGCRAPRTRRLNSSEGANSISVESITENVMGFGVGRRINIVARFYKEPLR